jgi:hypothetical protein
MSRHTISQRVVYSLDIFDHVSDRMVLSLPLNKKQTLAMLSHFAPPDDPAMRNGDYALRTVFFGATVAPATIPAKRPSRRPLSPRLRRAG